MRTTILALLSALKPFLKIDEKASYSLGQVTQEDLAFARQAHARGLSALSKGVPKLGTADEPPTTDTQ